MPLIRCKTCDTKFTGFECPECGRHLSSRGCFATLLVLAVLLLISSLLFPGEAAPRIEEGTRGDLTYVFESLRRSTRAVQALTLFILFVGTLLCRIRLPHAAPPTPSTVPGLGGAGAMMFGSLGRVLRTCLLGLLVIVHVCLVILKPLGEYRALTVTDRGVQLHGLYHTKHLPFEKIREATTAPELARIDTSKPGHIDLRFVVKTENREYRSIRLRTRRSGSKSRQRLDALQKFLSATITDIHQRKELGLPAEATSSH